MCIKAEVEFLILKCLADYHLFDTKLTVEKSEYYGGAAH